MNGYYTTAAAAAAVPAANTASDDAGSKTLLVSSVCARCCTLLTYLIYMSMFTVLETVFSQIFPGESGLVGVLLHFSTPLYPVLTDESFLYPLSHCPVHLFLTKLMHLFCCTGMLHSALSLHSMF